MIQEYSRPGAREILQWIRCLTCTKLIKVQCLEVFQAPPEATPDCKGRNNPMSMSEYTEKKITINDLRRMVVEEK